MGKMNLCDPGSTMVHLLYLVPNCYCGNSHRLTISLFCDASLCITKPPTSMHNFAKVKLARRLCTYTSYPDAKKAHRSITIPYNPHSSSLFLYITWTSSSSNIHSVLIQIHRMLYYYHDATIITMQQRNNIVDKIPTSQTPFNPSYILLLHNPSRLENPKKTENPFFACYTCFFDKKEEGKKLLC